MVRNRAGGGEDGRTNAAPADLTGVLDVCAAFALPLRLAFFRFFTSSLAFSLAGFSLKHEVTLWPLQKVHTDEEEKVEAREAEVEVEVEATAAIAAAATPWR